MSIVTDYEEVLALSREMVKAATALDWNQLTRLGSEREVLLTRLPRTLPPLPPETGRTLASTISTILACDAEVRERAEPWLEHTRPLLQVLGKSSTEPKTTGNRRPG